MSNRKIITHRTWNNPPKNCLNNEIEDRSLNNLQNKKQPCSRDPQTKLESSKNALAEM